MLNLKLLNRIRNLTANKALVLMYHRIADLTTNPWQMGVSPCNFEQQLKVLQTKYKLISVADLITQLSQKSITPNTVCITFDDGYSDNYLAAKPLLEKYETPATFFISTHYVEQQKSFWWDELERIILSSKRLPSILSITIDKELFVFQLENDDVLTDELQEKQKIWIWTEKSPTRRCELYLALHRRLKPLPYNELQSIIREIKDWSEYDKVFKEDLPMTNQQLKDIAVQPLFDIGLHTATHSALPFHNREMQFKEIADNEQSLKDNCEKFARFLAYPFGAYNKATISVVKEQKLNAAFTTMGKPITNSSDLYQLGRFQVKNWDGKEFERRISNWIKNY